MTLQSPVKLIIIVLILFSCLHSDLIQISSEFTTNNFQSTDLGTWSAFPTSSSYISNCKTYHIFGGINIFGQGAYISKFITNLLPHYQMRFKLFLLIIDNWGPLDLFQIFVDSNITYQYSPSGNPQNYISSNQCGANILENGVSIDINFTNIATQFTLKLTNTLLKPSNQAAWGVRELITYIYSCDVTCLTCKDFFSYSCTSCYNLAILTQGICQCSNGYYLNVPVLPCVQMPCMYCSPCFSTCKTCAGPSYQDCLTCLSNLYLEPSGECSVVCINPFTIDSVNKKCISPCNSTQYVDKSTRSCQTCSSSCLTCFGPLADNCLSCSAISGTFLDYKTCVIQCPNSQYADLATRKCAINCASLGATEDPITKQCIPFQCNSPCLTCLFPNPDHCVTCNNGQVMINNTCFNLICDTTCLTCSGLTANECISCQNPRILVNHQCLSCEASCLTCNGIASNNCLTCEMSRFFVNNSCIPCPAPMIIYNNKCITCDGNCNTCNGPSYNNCLSCYSPKMLNISICANLVCDPSCKTCYGFTYKECISCYFPKILVNNQCIPCDNSCATCSGPLNNNCLTCFSPKYLHFNQCVDLVCDPSCFTCSGFNANECISCTSPKILVNNQCLSCDPSCITCYGIASNNCLTCDPIKFFTTTNNSCIPCPAPMIIYNNKCISCDSNCKTCNGPSYNNCLSCYSPKMLNISICANLICDPSCKTCSGFTYKECLSCYFPTILINYECIPCNIKCATCYGPLYDNCLTCPTPKYLHFNQCVDLICDPSCLTCNGFTAIDCLTCRNNSFFSNNQCISCYPSCLTCQGPSSTDCKSCPANKILHFSTCIDLLCDPTCLTCSGFTAFECLSCDHSKILINGSCLPCDPSCLTCKGPYNDSCISCPLISHLNTNSQCISYKCEESCDECKGLTLLDCISCKDPRVFINGLCLYNRDCPDVSKGFWNETLNRCVASCDASHWKLPQYDNCISDCPIQGFFSNPISRVCLKCPPKCLYCDSDLNCIKCDSGYYKNDGFCVTFCPDNKYSDPSFTCQYCDPKCLLCSSNGEIQCISCQSPYFFDGILLKCVLVCSGTQYGNILTNRCDQCNLDCETCVGPYNQNCLSCSDPKKLLWESEGICSYDCPEHTVLNKTTRVCRVCVIENCVRCDNNNPYSCSLCNNSYYLDKTHSLQCVAIKYVDVSISLLYNPVVYMLTFSMDWPDLFTNLLLKTRDFQIISKKNARRNLNPLNFSYDFLKNDLNPLQFFINFHFFQGFDSQQSLILIMNYSSAPPTQKILKTMEIPFTILSYKQCSDPTTYYNILSNTCIGKSSLTPLYSLNYDNSLEVFLSYPIDSPILINKTLESFVINAVNILINVKSTDLYTYNINKTGSSGLYKVEIQYTDSEIGRPLMTLFLTIDKIPLIIRLNPAYSFTDIRYINLLPYYLLSENTKKAINSSSNATTIADIVTEATAIANTILHSGSSFVIRGLMLSQYIYSLAYLTIQFPPNVINMFKSQTNTQSFSLPSLEKETSDINKLPEILLIFKKSPFYVENYGVNLIQIFALLMVSIVLKLLFLINMINRLKFLKPLFFFFNWNFVIVYTLSQINKLSMYAAMNLKYNNFITINGRYNFVIALFSVFYGFCFFFHILLITYTLKKYALEEEIPSIPPSPKKITLAEIKTVRIIDKNNNLFEVKTENLQKSLNFINDLKKNQVAPVEKIEEKSSESEESPQIPRKALHKRATVLENMLASPKKPKKKTKKVKEKPKNDLIPFNSENEIEFFQLERTKFLKSLQETESNEQKTKVLGPREINTAESVSNLLEKSEKKPEILEENKEFNENLDENKGFSEDFKKEKNFNEFKSLTNAETNAEIPEIRLSEVIDSNSVKNIFKLSSLKKSLSEINRQRLIKGRKFLQKTYEKLYVPKDLSDYRKKFAILHTEIKQNHWFQTYFISIDFLRHFSMSFLIIMILEYGLIAIIILFTTNMVFLTFLIKYQPIKSKFFMNFSIVNEFFINLTFAMTMILAILDKVDNTGYVTDRVNLGWILVFSSLSLLYFLIGMTILRFLRGFLISILEMKKKSLKNNTIIPISVITEANQKKNEENVKNHEIFSLKEIEENEKNTEKSLEKLKNENFQNSIENHKNNDIIENDESFRNPFEEAIRELGVEKKKEPIIINKKRFFNDRSKTQIVPIREVYKKNTEISKNQENIGENPLIIEEIKENEGDNIEKKPINDRVFERVDGNIGNNVRKKKFFNDRR